ncbi:Bidirectional sugar transporter [Seminavis robusta]|uniref:Sugar transporter SWEET1 n=1 Tax=Seminavis robusta TaxID=568900 RepID=A0A9N8E0B0_9STRA|nr:Bidirectional sugar transporter [Seminavis robusta]|eukprot:Sro435_g142410.1 Bidirectional sugar transporter (244) ;mRNA; f:52808-53899
MFLFYFVKQVLLPKFMAVCECLAPLSSVLVFLAPIPTILQVYRNGTVGDLPLLPYTAMLNNAFLWFIYGFLNDEPKIWTSNAVGFFIGCFYFLEFIRFAPKRSRTLPGSITQHFHFCFALVLGTLLLALIDTSGAVIGHLAVLFCVAMFASPLAALPTVMETKSAKAIPMTYTVAVLANSILWTIVGILDMHDINIYVPTTLGLGLSALQIGLKVKYGNGPSDLLSPTTMGTDLYSPVLLYSP